MMTRSGSAFGWILLLCAVLLLGACAKKEEDPLAALNVQVDHLMEALQTQHISNAMAVLHPQFKAQDNLGQDWARQTMTAMFLRYNNIGVRAMQRDARLAIGAREAAEVKGRLLLTGAEGVLPSNGNYVEIDSEWRLEDGEWKLFRLRWQ